MKRKMEKLLIPFLTVALLSVPPLARADLFEWNSPGVVTIEDPIGDSVDGSSVGDITRVRYGSDSGYHYFRMDLQENPASVKGQTNYYLYEVDIFSELGLQIVAGSMDGWYEIDTLPTEGLTGDAYLEWKVSREFLDSVYTFWGSTFLSEGGEPYIDIDETLRSSPAATPTPIPAAAWLFASGLAALAGLKGRGKNV